MTTPKFTDCSGMTAPSPVGQMWSTLKCCIVFSEASALHTLLKLMDQSKLNQFSVVTQCCWSHFWSPPVTTVLQHLLPKTHAEHAVVLLCHSPAVFHQNRNTFLTPRPSLMPKDALLSTKCCCSMHHPVCHENMVWFEVSFNRSCLCLIKW